MLIKIGFDIELTISAPMALIYLLHVHPSRQDDLQTPENFHVSPPVEVDDYIDYFGNHCGRINFPAGIESVRFTNDGVVADSACPIPPPGMPGSTIPASCPSAPCSSCSRAAIARSTAS